MPADQHDNPDEEPSPESPPGRPEDDPAPVHVTFMLREPTSRARIQPQVTRIGRSPHNDIIVSDLGVSKHHAELRRSRAGRYSITDLNSHNGTYVNGTRVSQQEPHELQEGDLIAIGHATLRLVGGQLIEYTGDDRSPG